jgi:adenosylhomocysteine nucleosidase
MLRIARTIKPELDRCGPKNVSLCVPSQPRLVIGGRGITLSTFLDNSNYRNYLSQILSAVSVDMETAAFAHVAYANGIPFLAFRALSDQAGGTDYKDVAAFFGSGLAETNESRVTLAFLRAWSKAHGIQLPHSGH